MLKWRIYYDDGSTFDNLQGTADEAPPFGVQSVVQLTKAGSYRTPLTGLDYYVMLESGEWVGSDLTGILDKLINRIPFSGFLVGRWVELTVFHEVTHKAMQDRDFPGYVE
jgi:hypothetical protein